MTVWLDLDGDAELPCILKLEKEDIRVKVYEDADHPGPVGYLIEMFTFSELRNEWRLIARIGDFDLHTIILLLLETATELYRLRGIGSPPQPPLEE